MQKNTRTYVNTLGKTRTESQLEDIISNIIRCIGIILLTKTVKMFDHYCEYQFRCLTERMIEVVFLTSN
jgi:hypothetical protein